MLRNVLRFLTTHRMIPGRSRRSWHGWGVWLALPILLPLLACGASTTVGGGITPTLPPAAAFPPIDGISCDQGEHGDYHIHVHVTMYINDQLVEIPANVGIAPDGSCIYWLHTHDNSGIIHVEAPSTFNVTLNDFFDIWGQEFASLGYPSQLSQGGWSGYVNGQQISDISAITFNPYDAFTLELNSSQPPDSSYNWPSGY